ncbi:MAG TPA: HAMP domain-containing sensor histidine kinase [Bryobacteraceae bacterium]|nr:HAMP domain-containing sensor histidine kinase [Bryobacteraceae bacterium]
MNRLRNKLVVVFLVATLAPLGVTVWVTTLLLEQSLGFTAESRAQLDEVSKSLEVTGREYYQRACASLKSDALAGGVPARKLDAADPEARDFLASGETERFHLTGGGNRLEYRVRRGSEVWSYSTGLDVDMRRLTEQIAQARESVAGWKARDWWRGFVYTYGLLALGIWLAGLALLAYMAGRISRPIQQLTAGLAGLAAGKLETRLPGGGHDEVGRAVQAFNHMAGQLQQNRDRLVYLTQLASWQTLARKMAHEVKNSLTPIRLTVEEMLVRHGESDSAFLQQAAQIVVDEVDSLERRIRAFSEFAAEPPVRPGPVVVDNVLQERIAFLRTGHPEVAYDVRLSAEQQSAFADEDLVKGVLTNLLENAAEAAGPGGRILAATLSVDSKVAIEIHDSGPGLSEQARQSLFQPTISFKKRGMGLGLSIARKSALLLGGDILPVKGELGGAAFRVLLPAYETNSDRG